MKPADRLARALKQHPPKQHNAGRSVLDRPDVLEVIRLYLEGRAAGENYGSWQWFRNRVILAQYEIDTTTGNVKRFAQSRYPDLYERASRPGR